MFVCKNNKFLATMVNSRNLKEVHFSYNHKGHTVLYTNIEILDISFKTATKSQLIQTQQLLQQQRFSEKAINDFAYHFGEEFIVKRQG